MSFTLLMTPIDQVLMQIKDEEALTYPRKLKGDPNRRSKDKYCRFHRYHGHDTVNCYDLKQQIEAIIKQGKLQKFVRKETADQPPQEQNPRRDNERPRPPHKGHKNDRRRNDSHWVIQKGPKNLP